MKFVELLRLENEEFRHNLDRCLRKKAISFGDTSVSLETIEKFLKFVVSLAKEGNELFSWIGFYSYRKFFSSIYQLNLPILIFQKL